MVAVITAVDPALAVLPVLITTIIITEEDLDLVDPVDPEGLVALLEADSAGLRGADLVDTEAVQVQEGTVVGNYGMVRTERHC